MRSASTGTRSAAASSSGTSTSTCRWRAWRRCTCRLWPGSRKGRGSRISSALACWATASCAATSRSNRPEQQRRRGEGLPEYGDESWERDDTVRRTIVLPSDLAERLAAVAGPRGKSIYEALGEEA